MEGYTKLRQIGKGNMGVCHLAKAPDGNVVVLKTVTMWKMGRKEKTRAEQEAKLLKAVKHPNIVRYVHSWVTRGEDLMIAMEYVKNGDLCSHIEKTKFRGLWEETKVLDWFIQIALAMHYTGKKHILHRDLKTQNILVAEDNTLKLADFGISRSLGNTWEQANTFVGTPYYLAPELVMQQPYNIQVDAWALGVVLCEMLTLTHPFTGHDMKSLANNIVKGIYKKPSAAQYSPEIRQLVTQLLVKDPKRRMTVAQALQTPLVQKRLKQWLEEDGAVPRGYLLSLVNEGCLEGVVPPALLNVKSVLEEIPSPKQSPTKEQQRQEVEAIVEDAQRRRSEERERIRREFQDLGASPAGLRGAAPPPRPAPVMVAHSAAATPSVAAPSPLHRGRGVAPSRPEGPPPPRGNSRGGARSPSNARSPSAGGRSPSVGGRSPSAGGAGRVNSRFPPVHGAGAYPGHFPVAHPRDLLAEKRRIMALMDQQANAEAANNHRRRASALRPF